MRVATERQTRARKGKTCILTTLNNSCGKSEEVEIEGQTFRLCPFHHHNLLRIVADAKKADRRYTRQRLEEDAA